MLFVNRPVSSISVKDITSRVPGMKIKIKELLYFVLSIEREKDEGAICGDSFRSVRVPVKVGALNSSQYLLAACC